MTAKAWPTTRQEQLIAALSADYTTADLTPADRAMLAYAVKLTQEPAAIASADIAALRSALEPHYPAIGQVRLDDYKVRIINGRRGTAARTRVFISSTDGKAEWGTVGVSDNIIEASWQALVDSFDYAVLRAGRAQGL